MPRTFVLAMLGCLGIAVCHPAWADLDRHKPVYLVAHGRTAIVWRDYDAWLGGMLRRKMGDGPDKIVPLWSCVTKSGTKVVIVDMPTDEEATIVVIDGDRAGCAGFTPAVYLSNDPAAQGP